MPKKITRKTEKTAPAHHAIAVELAKLYDGQPFTSDHVHRFYRNYHVALKTLSELAELTPDEVIESFAKKANSATLPVPQVVKLP